MNFVMLRQAPSHFTSEPIIPITLRQVKDSPFPSGSTIPPCGGVEGSAVQGKSFARQKTPEQSGAEFRFSIFAISCFVSRRSRMIPAHGDLNDCPARAFTAQIRLHRSRNRGTTCSVPQLPVQAFQKRLFSSRAYRWHEDIGEQSAHKCEQPWFWNHPHIWPPSSPPFRVDQPHKNIFSFLPSAVNWKLFAPGKCDTPFLGEYHGSVGARCPRPRGPFCLA